MATPSQFHDALARLDADIEAAEQQLADLKLKRKGAEAFLVYTNLSEPAEATSLVGTGGPAEVVFNTVQRFAETTFTVNGVLNATTETGNNFTREQVRNALHYLVRKRLIIGVARGFWRLSGMEGDYQS